MKIELEDVRIHFSYDTTKVVGKCFYSLREFSIGSDGDHYL